MKGGGSDVAKKRAGESAAQQVRDGMVVGLGTGSTAAYAVRKLGERVDAGLDIRGIPTSYQSRQLARDQDIPLTALDEATPDIAIDGADAVVDGTAIKGGGAAHAREKVVDTAANSLLIVVDATKVHDQLTHPIPVEVLPTARTTVASRIASLGGEPVLRAASKKDGPVVTDNGNLVLDCDFEAVSEPESLANSLATIPGVVEHGLFFDCISELHVGTESGVRIERY